MFSVSDKVVCVDDANAGGLIKQGTIYCVSRVFVGGDVNSIPPVLATGVVLLGVNNHEGYAGWLASRFRKVGRVENKAEKKEAANV